jgi:hypothetical protein
VRRSLDRLIASKDLRAALAEIDPGLRLRRVAAPRGLAARATAYQLRVPSVLLETLESSSGLDRSLPGLLFGSGEEMLSGPVGIVRSLGKTAKLEPTTALTLIIQPTAQGDWIGLSTAGDQLAKIMRPLAAGALPPAQQRPELARLRLERTISGDFFDLRSLKRLLTAQPELDAFFEARGGADALHAPIVSSLRVEREQRGLKARLSYFLPKATVEALGQLLMLEPARLPALGLKPSAASPGE